MRNLFLKVVFVAIVPALIAACGTVVTSLPTAQTIACDISPRLPDHAVSEQMRAPVGQFPVWFVTFDSAPMSEFDRSFTPYDGGTIRKSLIVVSTELRGDLVITGRQLDGDSVVLFPIQINDVVYSDNGSHTIRYSDDDLATQKVIHEAQHTTNSTSARGYASHSWAAYYPAPGCYQLSAEYGGYTSTAIVEIRDE